MDSRIEDTLAHFKNAHIDGGLHLLRPETAFLSFLCTLSAIEGLAGYKYSSKGKGPGERYLWFIRDYFPPSYQAHLGRLWPFRNGMVHAFTPRQMSITLHEQENLKIDRTGTPILGATSFFGDMRAATQAYERDLEASPDLQEEFLHRLGSTDGGEMHVAGPRTEVQ